MLYVIFKACSDAYALEARKVIEVIPVVALRACPGAPAGIAGLANFRGTAVPVLDFCRLAAGAPCPMQLSARIILTDCPGTNGSRRVIGLLVEAVLETSEREESDFSESGVQGGKTDGLGALAVRESAFVQRVIPEQLLNDGLERVLFPEKEKFQP